MRESQLSAKYVNWLRDRGFMVFKLNDRLTPGIPDAAVVSGRGTTWIEFKRWPVRITEVQREVLKTIEKRTGRAYIVVVLEVPFGQKLYVISPGLEDFGQYKASPMTYEEATKRMDL